MRFICTVDFNSHLYECSYGTWICLVFGPVWWWPRNVLASHLLSPSPRSSKTWGSRHGPSAPPSAAGSMWPFVFRWVTSLPGFMQVETLMCAFKRPVHIECEISPWHNIKTKKKCISINLFTPNVKVSPATNQLFFLVEKKD